MQWTAFVDIFLVLESTLTTEIWHDTNIFVTDSARGYGNDNRPCGQWRQSAS